MTRDAPGWYSAKTVYKHHFIEDGDTKFLFEERVVLFRAASLDDAIVQAEAEAAKYCAGSSRPIKYINYVMAYQLLFEEEVGHGTEVFSLMRESTLSNNAYLDRFFDDGHERTQTTRPNT